MGQGTSSTGLQEESHRWTSTYGNLSYRATEDELRQAFETFGQVDGVQIVKDKITGQSRGFAFVQMPQQSEAEAAIAGMPAKKLAAAS